MLSLAELSALNPMSIPMIIIGIIMLIVICIMVFIIKDESKALPIIATILTIIMISLPLFTMIYGYTETKTITPCNIVGNTIVDTSDNIYYTGSNEILLKTHINTTVDVQLIYYPFSGPHPIIVNTTGKMCSLPVTC